MRDAITAQLDEHCRVMELIRELLADKVAAAVGMICRAILDGHKILIMGNGGSAADAQHFAAEIVSRFKLERKAWPALALTTDTSLLTAIGNDYGFDAVFRRQIEAFADAGDVVIGISTSGNSPNVLAAMSKARELGCLTLGLLGRDGGHIKEFSDIEITIPVADTPRIQEGHITIIHILCDLVERTVSSEQTARTT
jgi:D-sedoheptulose 7-phosphate isomerase